MADFEDGDHPSPLARGRGSGSHAKNDVHDAFDFTETLRVEVEGDFDVFVILPDDLEREACGCEVNEPQAVVAGVGIVIEGLDVADAAIIILELTLNEKIGLIGGDKSRSSSLGSSLSNETWKYSPPASPMDTCLAWSLTGGGLASVTSFVRILTPIARRATSRQRPRTHPVSPFTFRVAEPAFPSGRHWSGAKPGRHCHYVPASVTCAISFGSSLLPVRSTRSDTGRHGEIMSAFRRLRSSERITAPGSVAHDP